MDRFFTISKAGLEARLCFPSATDGYYRGTRFDWAGVFRSISKNGHIYADTWFDGDDPLRHDNVCGPSEEFVIFDTDRSRRPGIFTKIGVGRLIKDDGLPYDRFRLYKIADYGKREIATGEDYAQFIHEINGEYAYTKHIRIDDDGCMTIRHRLKNLSSALLETSVYNHNFFTLDNLHPGPDTIIEFPFRLSGHWREKLAEVSLEGNTIRFNAHLEKGGKSAFIGDLHAENPFSFKIGNAAAGISVNISTDAPVSYSVFWSNHRVSCVEPYTHIKIRPGEEYEWSIFYRFG